MITEDTLYKNLAGNTYPDFARVIRSWSLMPENEKQAFRDFLNEVPENSETPKPELKAQVERFARRAEARIAGAHLSWLRRNDCLVTLPCGKTKGTRTSRAWIIDTDGAEIRPLQVTHGKADYDELPEDALVLVWSKGATAAPHEFSILQWPETMTEAQCRAAPRIEDELQANYPRDRMGEGFGLTERALVGALYFEQPSLQPNNPFGQLLGKIPGR